jgi:hypothetical protein
MATAAKVNEIVATKQMPIGPGATYVFDLGYYDYAWWASLHEASCRIVTWLKANTPFTLIEERPVEAGSVVLSDRVGRLPKRLAALRKNPMADLVRDVRVRIETGKILRIFTNDLEASSQEIADLYNDERDLPLVARAWSLRRTDGAILFSPILPTAPHAEALQIAPSQIVRFIVGARHFPA